MNTNPRLLPRVKLEDFLAKNGLQLIVKEVSAGRFEATVPALCKTGCGTYGSVFYDPVCGDGELPHDAIENLCVSVGGAALVIMSKASEGVWQGQVWDARGRCTTSRLGEVTTLLCRSRRRLSRAQDPRVLRLAVRHPRAEAGGRLPRPVPRQRGGQEGVGSVAGVRKGGWAVVRTAGLKTAEPLDEGLTPRSGPVKMRVLSKTLTKRTLVQRRLNVKASLGRGPSLAHANKRGKQFSQRDWWVGALVPTRGSPSRSPQPRQRGTRGDRLSGDGEKEGAWMYGAFLGLGLGLSLA